MLQRALTHASKRTEKGKVQDNERLEFLGDRVLALAIAELLDGARSRTPTRATSPAASIAWCARRPARASARDLGLGSALVLSAAEAESGGRDKDTILADACEALLAAVFLEAGFPAARDVVRRLWAPMIDKLPDVATDAKSALQEWAQGPGIGAARICGGRAPRSRPCAEVHCRGSHRRPQAGARGGGQQACRRAGRRHGAALA